MISASKLEFGDYQTPVDFCNIVIDVIYDKYKPKYVFEPTFGLGHFIDSSIKKFKNVNTFYGNEINPQYYNDYKTKNNKNVKLFNENIFTFNHKKIKDAIKNEPMLIIGNPPWVTNSQLMSEELKNLPQKSNFKNLKGIDSITGASNFDICEYILIDLLSNYAKSNVMIAMLCKTSVATNMIKNIKNYPFKLKNISLYLFDAKKVFNVGCEACLFVAQIDECGSDIAKVYNIANSEKLLYEFGWKNGKFHSKFKELNYDIDGKFFTEWRQGVKHDCSKIMELTKKEGNGYTNKLNENLILEDKYIYPLLKSSDLKNNYITKSNKYVIIPQKTVRESTMHIEKDAPKTWNYLKEHEDLFNSRKSSIYKNCPPFSIFGIGDYSFGKYKVAISGFYKDPNFVLLNSEKPIMLDDTCYFVSFDNIKDAYITMILLNSKQVKDFLFSIAFLDKKRPYTKDILMRIDIKKILNYFNYNNFKKEIQHYSYDINISEADYIKYTKSFLNNEQLSLL